MKRSLFTLFFIIFAIQIFANTTIYAPTLNSPANGAIDQMPNALLDWSAVSGATSYEVQIDQDSLFPAPTSYIATVTAKNASELLFNTKYYWRVRALSTAGNSGWSTFRNFTTIVKITNLTSPNNGATNITPQFDLEWTAITGVTNYDYQIDTSSTFSSSILVYGSVSGTTPKYTTNNLLYGTQHYWRIRARHSFDTTIWTPSRNFTTLDSLNLTSPANNATNQSIVPELKWSLVKGSSKYEVQVDLTNSFNTPSLISSTVVAVPWSAAVNTQSIICDTLNFGLQYFWRVRSINNNDTSKWSAVWKLQTINAVNMIYPLNGSTWIETNPKFNWDAIAGINGYTLTWSTSPSYASATTVNIAANTSEYSVNNLGIGVKYYWKVVAKTNSDTSIVNSFSFTTKWGVGIETTTLNPSNIKVYPNPSKGKFTVKVETSNSLSVDLSISNLVGQTVYTEDLTINGLFTKEINLSSLPKGIYFLKLEDGKSSNIQKFIIQ
ncbi:MAG: T9SS type A sorting domain-containing protein [Bacteroidetes bacterium]|nr:T9SS type A sorting domain-containing protein [Bacteroidota bacterium]